MSEIEDLISAIRDCEICKGIKGACSKHEARRASLVKQRMIDLDEVYMDPDRLNYSASICGCNCPWPVAVVEGQNFECKSCGTIWVARPITDDPFHLGEFEWNEALEIDRRRFDCKEGFGGPMDGLNPCGGLKTVVLVSVPGKTYFHCEACGLAKQIVRPQTFVRVGV